MTIDILLATNPDNPVIIGSISKTIEEKASQLPKPSGYHILCAIPEQEKEFDSGIIKADSTIHYEELLTTVLFVVSLGQDCYTDATRFPSGAWCKVGDFILVRPNAGSRLVIHGKEFRMINDDSVEGVVLDPRGIRRSK
jgi:co-chaperonin GroES (HSP10)